MSWMIYTRPGFWLKAISWQRSFTEGWIAAGLSAKRRLFLERTHKEVKSCCRIVWRITMLSCSFSAVQWSACHWEA